MELKQRKRRKERRAKLKKRAWLDDELEEPEENEELALGGGKQSNG